jgi:RND family efflux transporter MFP subunit
MMRLAAALGAFALVVGGGVACRQANLYQKPLTPVRVQAATSYTESNGVRYSGTVDASLRVDLAFKTGGYVERLLQVRGADGRSRSVQEGDPVTRGVVLATVRDTDYVDRRNQALSQLRQADVSRDYATEEFERADRLFASNSVTKVDRDGAKTKLDVARAQVDGAQALVQQADDALADGALKAPIDGVVMKRVVEVGSLVGPGSPGFVLADTRQVKVLFGAPDVIIKTVKIGAPQTVTTASLPDAQFHGMITRIAPVADPRSRVFDVEVTIPNSDGRLKVGMVVALQVAEGAPVSAPVVVPLTAIVRAHDQASEYAVMIVEDRDGHQIARLRTVQLGQAFGNSIAVTSGLRTGERVIVAGVTLVTDGEQVSITQS